MNLYRIYIDEVGNHHKKESLRENERFLTLFGAIVNSQHMMDVVQPEQAVVPDREYEFRYHSAYYVTKL